MTRKAFVKLQLEIYFLENVRDGDGDVDKLYITFVCKYIFAFPIMILS